MGVLLFYLIIFFLPVVRELYEGYEQNGISGDLHRLIAAMPGEFQEPVIHTFTSHVTKEKPLFVYSLGRSLGSSHEDATHIAVAIDLLWTLSLIYDDALDKDELRAGKEAAWVLYGKDKADQTVSAGIQTVAHSFREHFGKGAEDQLSRSVDISVGSLYAHGKMPIDERQESILSNYDERAHFHTHLPLGLIAELTNCEPEKYDCALTAIVGVNLAGQILNDLKDMSPAYNWLREGFSDFRTGRVTYPISVMYTRANTTQQEYLKSKFGKNNLENSEKSDIRQILNDTATIKHTSSIVGDIYIESLENFGLLLDGEYINWPEQWIGYKFTQLKEL